MRLSLHFRPGPTAPPFRAARVVAGLLLALVIATLRASDLPAAAAARPPELVLLKQFPRPVITPRLPEAGRNRFGFEGGTTVKIGGIYHLFVSEIVGEPFWVHMRLAHWTSRDRLTWQRAGTLWESSGDYTGKDPRASLWSPMVVWDPADGRWNLFYVAYHSAPSTKEEFRENYHGRIWRATAQAKGREGIQGPYLDQGIVLEPGPDSDPWEGLQGTDSFYPWKVGSRWYAFYGSAQTEHLPVNQWRVGLAAADSLAGTWQRLSSRNPLPIESRFIENPIVTPLSDGGWLCVYDTEAPDAIGWAYSADGITWGPGHALVIQPTPGTWAENVRTPLGLVDEGAGRFSLFYTGFEQARDLPGLAPGQPARSCAIGLVELQLKR